MCVCVRIGELFVSCVMYDDHDSDWLQYRSEKDKRGENKQLIPTETTISLQLLVFFITFRSEFLFKVTIQPKCQSFTNVCEIM